MAYYYWQWYGCSPRTVRQRRVGCGPSSSDEKFQPKVNHPGTFLLISSHCSAGPLPYYSSSPCDWHCLKGRRRLSPTRDFLPPSCTASRSLCLRVRHYSQVSPLPSPSPLTSATTPPSYSPSLVRRALAAAVASTTHPPSLPPPPASCACLQLPPLSPRAPRGATSDSTADVSPRRCRSGLSATPAPYLHDCVDGCSQAAHSLLAQLQADCSILHPPVRHAVRALACLPTARERRLRLAVPPPSDP